MNPQFIQQLGVEEFIQLLKEKIGPYLEKGVEEIKKRLEELAIKIADEKLPQWIELAKRLINAKNIKFEKLEELTMPELFKIAKNNIAKGSNCVAVYRQKKENGTCVFLAYCKDHELLPEKDNCYIAIEALKLDAEVENMFNKSELVILK